MSKMLEGLSEVSRRRLLGSVGIATAAAVVGARSAAAAEPAVIDASSVSYTPSGLMVSTDVQEAITELDRDKASSSTSNVFAGDQSIAGALNVWLPGHDADPFGLRVFGSDADFPIMFLGYNIGAANPNVPQDPSRGSIVLGLESRWMADYNPTLPGLEPYQEWYIQTADATDGTIVRPIMGVVDRDDPTRFMTTSVTIGAHAYNAFRVQDVEGNPIFNVNGTGPVAIYGRYLKFLHSAPFLDARANTTGTGFRVVTGPDARIVWFDRAKDGLVFGPQADTNLFRGGVNLLETEDALAVGDTLTVAGQTLTLSHAAPYLLSPNAKWGMTVVTNDRHVRFDHEHEGLAFGEQADTNLYRTAADTLKTDDQLVVGDGVTGKYKAGPGVKILSDSDFATPPADGTMGVAHNTTSGRSFWCIRAGGRWKSVECT